jgi:hypothetical protein
MSFFLMAYFFNISPSRPLVSYFSIYFDMESLSDLLLTSTNYFSWKSHIEDVLKSKALYQITLGKELEPNNDENKVKWANNSDEERGLIKMSISLDLRVHLQGIDSPDASWNKVEFVFGKHNIIRSH